MDVTRFYGALGQVITIKICEGEMVFLLHILTLASTRGPCPPQLVSLLSPAPSSSPSSDWLRLLSSQTLSLINTPALSSQLFFLLVLPMKVEQCLFIYLFAVDKSSVGYNPVDIDIVIYLTNITNVRKKRL